jgi:DNA gyrase subunit A
MKTDGERGKLAGVRVVNPEMHELVIVSNLGTTIRLGAETVSQQGRTAQGVRVMNLRNGDSVSALASVVSSRDSAGQESDDELSLEEIVGDEVAAEAAPPTVATVDGQEGASEPSELSENGGGATDE